MKRNMNKKNIGRRALPIAAVALLLALSMLLPGCAIIKDAINGKPANTASAVTPEPAPTEASEPTAEPTAKPTPEPAPTKQPPLTRQPREDDVFKDVRNIEGVHYDYFAIPDIILGLMSKADIELYKRVVLAYFAGEERVEVGKEYSEHPDLWRVIDMYCPVFFLDVDDTTIKETEDEITWEYADKAAHASNIEMFEERIDDLLACVPDGAEPIMRLLAMYKEYTRMIEYDGSLTVEDDESSPYVYRHSINALMNGVGVCWCFARGFNFLICQLGFESATVHGLRGGDNAIHEWVVFRDGGEWRYCDPTWDIYGTLTYFGFTIRVREHYNFAERRVSVLEGSSRRASDYFPVNDKFFSPLYTNICSGDDYRLDFDTNEIIFSNSLGITGMQDYISFNVLTGEVKYR